MNHCHRCKQEKSDDELIKGGKYSWRCRACNTELCRAFRKTSTGKKSAYQAVRKYLDKNPERSRAWGRARCIPSMPCEVCGVTERIHRHHPDIARPMVVQFLCPLHHKLAERELSDTM